MKLSVNISNLMARYDLARCIDVYKAAGFTAMDYSLCPMYKDDSPFCGDGWRAEAEQVRKLADEKGMPVNQTHAPFQFKAAQFDNEWDMVYGRLVRSLEISAILGAKIAVVHPIHHMEFHGHEEEIFERNMAFYRSLIPYCKEYGIKVGVENMWRNDPRRKCIVADTCSRSAEFVRYIDTLDSEYMVACLDLGHVGLPLTDEEAEDVIRVLGHDRLKALHVHDNDYQRDQHLLPYMGKMHWGEIAKALGEIDYTGDLTYEVIGTLVDHCDEGFVPIGAAFMANVGNHLCEEIERYRKRG